MEAEIVLTFCTAAFFLALAPGPDNLFVLSQSALFGIRAGLWVTLGLCSGLIFHTLAVVLGVAAILKANPSAMSILQLSGALYLLHLARLSFLSDQSNHSSGASQQMSFKQLYLRGLIMNITNPKVTMFFLAFLPQFVRETASLSVSVQLALLGFFFQLVTFLVFGCVSFFSGRIGKVLRESTQLQNRLNQLAGLVFLVLAALILKEFL